MLTVHAPVELQVIPASKVVAATQAALLLSKIQHVAVQGQDPADEVSNFEAMVMDVPTTAVQLVTSVVIKESVLDMQVEIQ